MKLRGCVDRIEDGRIAVITFEGGGTLNIPVKQLDFKIYEGMWLEFDIRHIPEKEKEMKQKVIELQKKLLKKKK